jgi:hypothetical protein
MPKSVHHQSTNGHAGALPLCTADLENLRASGLTDATILKARIRTERDDQKINAALRRGPRVLPR